MMRQTILAFFVLITMVTMGQAEEGQIIILLGAPGSGKGTQATQITKKLEIPHISTGDLFRENISKNTPLGIRAKEFTNAGKLVPDQVVLDMLSDRIANPDCIHGYLLDGFPRTIPQAEAFDQLRNKDFKLSVVYLEVSDEVIMKRIEGRRQCKGCGAINNVYTSPSDKPNVCDDCNGELVQRSDDKAEVVKERLKVFHEQTKPLIRYYEDKHLLYKIQGEQDPDKILQQILKVVT